MEDAEMSARSLREIGLVISLMILVSLVVSPAYALTAAQEPPLAGIGNGNWQTMCGQPFEFTFSYIGGGLPTRIKVGATPSDAVGFNAYTDQQWQGLVAGNSSITPVGRGTPNTNEPGNLFWQLQSPDSGFYHVQVFQLSNQPAQFWIAMDGSGSGGLVSVTPACPMQTQSQAPARTGIGNWQTLNGQPQEFDFSYIGGNLPARINVGANPSNSVAFNVYTDKQWQGLAAGNTDIVPVGKGTPNSDEPGNLFWQAQSDVGDHFHVQVFQLTPEPAQFWIQVTGSGAGGLVPMSPAQ
jgi:hypothetical protein